MMSFWDIVSPRKKGTLVHVSLQARAESASSSRDVKSELKALGHEEGDPRRPDPQPAEAGRPPAPAEGGHRRGRATATAATTPTPTSRPRRPSSRRSRRPSAPKLAWDLGANDGHFSRLVAEHGAYVVAADGDHAAVDGLYRSLREEGDTRILPLVLNLADPSPNRGWRSKERLAFTDRAPDLSWSWPLP